MLKEEVKEIQIETPMDEIVRQMPEKPREQSIVSGTVIGKDKLAVYVDIPPFGTGLIFGREYLNARELLKEISVGDTVSAKVITPEGEDGYIELSLKEAKQALIWAEAKRAIEDSTLFTVSVKNANKGGLTLDWQGLDGFIPASQLKPEHYPKVADGDKNQIMKELKKLVGEKLEVYLISADPRDGKLIFSEKAVSSKSRRDIVSKYSLGDVVDGTVTGVVDFGVFVKIEEGFEGLVHISELDWSLVENPRDLYKTADKITAKIIEIKEDKISLSVKALKPNPWQAAEKKYHKDEHVTGVVIKHNKHGALVSIEEGVAGLVHVSEFASEDELKQKLALGKSYPFTINIFEPRDHKMTLSFGHNPPRAEVKTEEKKAEKKA